MSWRVYGYFEQRVYGYFHDKFLDGALFSDKHLRALHGQMADLIARTSGTLWTWSLFGGAALVTVLFLVQICGWRKRRLPPGPPGWPVIGNLLLLEQNVHQCLYKLSMRYGPIMRFVFGMKTAVVVSSASIAREILRENDQIFANRSIPVAARCIAYDASDIVWSPYGPRWRLLRKICVKELFSPASLEALHYLRRQQISLTIQSIFEDSLARDAREAPRAVNVGAKAFHTSLNLITNMMWSTDSFDQASARGLEFRRLIGEVIQLLGAPNVSDLIPFLGKLDLQGVSRKMKKLFDGFDRLFDTIIEERLSGRSKATAKGYRGMDFLQFLLDLKDASDGDSTPITMTDIKALLMDMIVGGTDTTSNTVEWAMAEILRNPEIMERTQKELEEVVGLDQNVEERHIAQLPYLEAIIKEALRLHPPLPLLVPHCPSENCEIAGYPIPKGTQIFVNVWGIQRDPAVWKDPLVFDPERFLGSKWDYSGRELEYFPFGSGRRICAGYLLANRMVHYTVASLLHSFQWSLPSEGTVDMSEKYGIVLQKAFPLIAVPKPRLLRHDLYYPGF